MQVAENMQVVRHAVDGVAMTFQVTDNAQNIEVQFFIFSHRDRRCPVFGSKYDLVEDLTVCAHSISLFRQGMMCGQVFQVKTNRGKCFFHILFVRNNNCSTPSGLGVVSVRCPRMNPGANVIRPFGPGVLLG